MNFYLKVFKSPTLSELHELHKQFYFIGRSDACHIKLDFKFISRCHLTLLLSRDNQRFYYIAHDGSIITTKTPSSSGVYINKKRISDGVRLASGDIISFSDTQNISYPYLEFIEEPKFTELPTDSHEFETEAA